MRKAINDSEPLEGALLALCGVVGLLTSQQQLPTQSHAEQRAAIRTSAARSARACRDKRVSDCTHTHTPHTNTTVWSTPLLRVQTPPLPSVCAQTAPRVPSRGRQVLYTGIPKSVHRLPVSDMGIVVFTAVKSFTCIYLYLHPPHSRLRVNRQAYSSRVGTRPGSARHRCNASLRAL